MERHKRKKDRIEQVKDFHKPIAMYLHERRRRILLATLPPRAKLAPPPWVESPQQIIGWLMSQLTPQSLMNYFDDLEEVAIQAADLVLLRLARKYLQGLREALGSKRV